jgi:hypothetical protein
MKRGDLVVLDYHSKDYSPFHGTIGLLLIPKTDGVLGLLLHESGRPYRFAGVTVPIEEYFMDREEVDQLAVRHGMFRNDVDCVWSDEDECYVATSRSVGVKAHGATPAEAIRELSISLDLVASVDILSDP